MKTLFNKPIRLWFALPGALILMITSSCNKNHDNNPDHNPVGKQNFTQVNLVSSSSSYTGARVDPNFINGWGITFSPTGIAWISAEGAGTSVVYDKTGAEILPAVRIPSPTDSTGGAPSGIIFNGTTDFALSNGNPARFIFAGTDGVISGWNGGGSAERIKDESATAAYTGLTWATNGGNNYLYAANFKAGRIDVFDKNFASVSLPFTDPTLPAGYSPFNIQNIDGKLYVMYAKVDPATHEEMKGASLGYVDIYNADGSFNKRFVSQGALNAPWGATKAPNGFLDGHKDAILIGNFGDGHINAYSASGDSLGSLLSNGSPITIDGLWGISFAPSTATTIDPNWLFFAAGPADEEQGLFGYIKK